MNLPLRLQQSESAPTAYGQVVPDTHKPKENFIDEFTKVLFGPRDVLENLPNPIVGIRFALGDTEQMKLFCSKRLELVSRSALNMITLCWYQRRALRHGSEPSVINSMTSKWRTCLQAKVKDGEYHQSDTFNCYSLPPEIVSEAVNLLLQGGATERNKAKLHDSWTMDLNKYTTCVVEKIAAGQFDKTRTKEFVQSTVLPSLFQVAQLYENRFQPMSNKAPSEHEISIEWSRYPTSRKQRVTREDTANSEVPSDSPTPAVHDAHEDMFEAQVDRISNTSNIDTPARRKAQQLRFVHENAGTEVEKRNPLKRTHSMDPTHPQYQSILYQPEKASDDTGETGNKETLVSSLETKFGQLSLTDLKALLPHWIEQMRPERLEYAVYGSEPIPVWWPLDVQYVAPRNLNLSCKSRDHLHVLIICLYFFKLLRNWPRIFYYSTDRLTDSSVNKTGLQIFGENRNRLVNPSEAKRLCRKSLKRPSCTKTMSNCHSKVSMIPWKEKYSSSLPPQTQSNHSNH
jgi:hypothetical protein